MEDSNSCDTIDTNGARNNESLHPPSLVQEYLLEHSDKFRELWRLRKLGWQDSAGDDYFKKQRARADDARPNSKAARGFYMLMRDIGTELNNSTGAFNIAKNMGHKPMILDFCVAPGGFLSRALELNKGAQAVGFSLPVESGGHGALLSTNRVTLKFLDITMLAEDMGVSADMIPTEHEDRANFLPRALAKDTLFDLVICDGQVLRTHARAEYREPVEARRLSCTQQVLGLEHLRPGGTFVMLLHRLDNVSTAKVLYEFGRFSKVQAFKPSRAHRMKGSLYMVATGVQSRSPQALAAVDMWRDTWMTATFKRDIEQQGTVSEGGFVEEELVKRFGPQLVDLGKQVWDVQAKALAQAPFMKKFSGAATE